MSAFERGVSLGVILPFVGLAALLTVFCIVELIKTWQAGRRTRDWMACRCDPSGCPVHEPDASKREAARSAVRRQHAGGDE